MQRSSAYMQDCASLRRVAQGCFCHPLCILRPCSAAARRTGRTSHPTAPTTASTVRPPLHSICVSAPRPSRPCHRHALVHGRISCSSLGPARVDPLRAEQRSCLALRPPQLRCCNSSSPFARSSAARLFAATAATLLQHPSERCLPRES
jgi:hypothetical protein